MPRSGCGGEGCFTARVRNLIEINNIIIPFFIKNPAPQAPLYLFL
jgi:hypothetical protein